MSFAASLRGMETGLLSPFIGILTDRLGTRKVLFAGGIASAIGLTLFAFTTSLVMFYGAFILMAIGMSVYMVAPLVAIANWFKKNVGIATGIAICGTGFSGLMVPFITNLISTYEWRTAIIILAIGIVVIILPLSLVFRHKPEQSGYLPEGQRDITRTEIKAMEQPVKVNIGVREAIRNSIFWRLGLSYIYLAIVINAVVTHVMPYLSSVGISRSSSSLVAMGLPLVSVVGRVGFGWLGDRYNRKGIASAGFVIMGLGMLCFGYTFAGSAWLLIPFLVFLGVGYGGEISLRPALAAEYFGRAHFGSVFGLLVGIASLGGILGPTLAGWSYDNWGAYQGIWYLFAGLAMIAVVLLLSLPRSYQP